MSTGIGETLREARRSRQLDLADVEQATKIRARLLDAIEEERWEKIPGRAYAHSFVRTYAEFLGLDPAPLLDRLKQALPSHADEEIPPEPIIHKGTIPRRAWWPTVAWLVTALGAGAVVAGVIALANGDGDGGKPRAGGERPTTESQRNDVESPTETAPATTEPAPPTIAPTEVSISLEATGTVWVCLEDERGERLVNSETLSAGERRGPFVGRRLRLGLGNGQIEVSADGEPVPVPDLVEPLGLELTPGGVRDLEPAQRPTCL